MDKVNNGHIFTRICSVLVFVGVLWQWFLIPQYPLATDCESHERSAVSPRKFPQANSR